MRLNLSISSVGGLIATMALALAVILAAAVAETIPPPNDCDRLAAFPGYEKSIGPGVDWDQLSTDPAIKACQEAFDVHSNEPRFGFQLGRAYLKAQNYDKALPLLNAAAEWEFVPAYFGLSLMYANGWGVKKDLHTALSWMEKAANTGMAAGQFGLAEFYYSGSGVEKDYEKSFSLLSAAAKQNYARGQYGLALLYLRGHGVSRDISVAVELLTRAANSGYPVAQNEIARLYFLGEGVPKDMAIAMKWFRMAAEAGNLDAQANLAEILIGDMGFPAGPDEAFKWATIASQGGNVLAQGNLGFLYHQGMGTEQNFEKARYWYDKAAKAGDTFSQVKLGLLYSDGKGGVKDQQKAVELYRQAAEKGDVTGQSLLAGAYYFGNGAKKDFGEAAKWYERAAEQGDSYSQWQIAKQYLEGKGIPKDIDRGISWLKKAANNNEKFAHRDLGDAYRYGKGVEKNISTAMQWYQKAVNSGDVYSLTLLAGIYLTGEGVEEDKAKAFELYMQAAKQGDTYAELMVGNMYLNGTGVEKNFAEAKDWSLKAASKGDASAQNILGYMYLEGAGVQKDYGEALRWFAAAAQQNQVNSLMSIAYMYEKGFGVRQNYQKATEFLLRAGKITMDEKTYNGPMAADVLGRLTSIYMQTGKYFLAEDVAKNLAVVWENVKGPNDIKVASILSILANIYYQQGRRDEAKAIFDRFLRITSGDSPEHKLLRATGQMLLAKIREDEGNLFEAEKLYLRIIENEELLKSTDATTWSGVLSSYGEVLIKMGKFEKAESILQQSKETIDQQYGQDHPFSVVVYANLANLSRRIGEYEKAESHFQKAWGFVRELGVEDHPLVALGLADFAAVYEAKGELDKALDAIRHASNLYFQRILRAKNVLSRGISTERNLVRRVFIQHVNLAFQKLAEKNNTENKLLQEAFMAGQLASHVSAGEAISRMSMRFSAKDEKITALIRERQDAEERWAQLDRRLKFDGTGNMGAMSRSDIELMKTEIPELKKQIRELDDEISRTLPTYANLTSLDPIKIREVQGVLRGDEALIKWTVGDDQTFLWVVARQEAKMYRIAAGKTEINNAVNELRTHLDPAAIKSPNDLTDFPIDAAHDLYKIVLGPAKHLLGNYQHLIVVPDAGLQSIPLGVLIVDRTYLIPSARVVERPETEKPGSSRVGDTSLQSRGLAKEVVQSSSGSERQSRFGNYKNLPWMAKRFAISVVPSVRSLIAFRSIIKRTRAEQPFIGYGNPILKSTNEQIRIRSVASYFNRRGSVNLKALHELPDLPDTADELIELAKYLGATMKDVRIGGASTEGAVKREDLSKYKVIAFATHGLVAGDLSGLAEPALVMTLPESPTTENDGLLTASEITRLKLDADLVILSACNTAAAGAEPGAESLSGLAKAFFFAGARALLVSHWPVISEAAKKLTTGMIDVLRQSQGIGRAEALRQSMLSLMQSDHDERYAHPIFWAPFVVVGEGGASKIN